MILYFSATGNTKYCAEFIASSTNDNATSLNDMMKRGVHEIDCAGQKRLGIFVPVYDLDMAYAVTEFLEGLKLVNVPEDCYVYGVFTCGSSAGASADTLRAVLSRKGLELCAAFVVVMPDNYVPLFPQKSESAKQSMLAKADDTLKNIAREIESCNHSFTPSGVFQRIATSFLRKFFTPSQRKVKSFTVNDNCIGCGLCERVCPMNIITLRDSRPVWTKDDCACCLACLHRCPKRAINRGRSAKNGRYTNPNVKL